jgi:hypothetical protein
MGTLARALRSPKKVASSCLVLGVLLGLGLAAGRRAIEARAVPVRLEAVSPDVFRPKVSAEWAAFKKKDAKAYEELLAVDFLAVQVDSAGTRNRDQATREVPSSVVNDFTLSRLEARPLGDDAAMVTYEVFVEFPPPAQIRFLRLYVTEVWVRSGEAWKLLHYQETRVK